MFANPKSKISFLAAFCITLVVAIIATLIYQFILRSNYQAELNQAIPSCENVADPETVDIYREQSWYLNENAPTAEAAKETHHQLTLRCTEINAGASWWVNPGTLEHGKRLNKETQELAATYQTQVSDARTFADYGYAYAKHMYAASLDRQIARFSGSGKWMLTDGDTSAALQAYNELNDGTESTDLTTTELKERIKIYNDYNARVVELVKEIDKTDFAEYIDILEKFPTVSDTRPHLGERPAAKPDARFKVTATDADIAKYIPNTVCGFKHSEGGWFNGIHPTFWYFEHGGSGSLYVHEVDAVFDEETRRPDNQPDGFGASYRGIGNSLCTNIEGAGECWEQTQDGRYWHMEIYGSVSRACFESGLVEWLQGVEKAQGNK